MKLSRIAEIGAVIGAATLAGINAYQHKRKQNSNKRSLFTRDHIALYSSLAAAGLAIWEIKKHRRLTA